MRRISLLAITILFTMLSAKCSTEFFNSGDGTTISDSSANNYATSQVPVPRGFTTLIGYSPSFASLSSYMNLANTFYVGFGYNVTSSNMINIKIYTGNERIDDQTVLLKPAKFALGGGSVEWMHRFGNFSSIHPVAIIGYEIATILNNQSGFTGSGEHVELGGEYFVRDNYSVTLTAVYRRRFYDQLILAEENQGNVVGYLDQAFGISASCLIHFNLTP
ncbi:MAG: hypothetical protein ACHQQQ_02890 [Bacteroidota bacterium]